ncbi:MAG TPA: hypothetical protein VJV22_02835 [Acidobacteriaceae bacterium]|jgi:hypothetical protein|nr:hypothetical protein [Acidobacteriaceae bacterium]
MKRLLSIGLIAIPLALAGCGDRQVVAYGPPPAYSMAERRGFDDGVRAAHWDMRHRRRPDFDDHERFRNPPVPPGLREEYRRGFHEGYDRALRDRDDRYDRY